MDRRRFLLAGGGWLGSQLVADAVGEGRAKTISIFHTTDLHGHIEPTVSYRDINDVGGIARCATQIRQWRKQFPDSLLVDAGDVYQGTPEGYATEGKLMIELFNRLGYDAWTLGNHDFDWGPEALDGVLKQSTPTVLGGNLSLEGKSSGLAGSWEAVKPWTVKTVGGFRIGLIGLTTPGLPYWLAKEALGGVEVGDPAVALAESIGALREEKVDAIVVTGHMGWRREDDFANPVNSLLTTAEGVDVYIGGHTHQDQPMWWVDRTLCTQANYFGIHCGRVDLTFDRESRRLIDRRAFTVRMDDRFPLDPGVMDQARPEIRKADEQMAREVCRVTQTIPMNGKDSMRTLFCRSFAAALERAGTPVDGVFHGTFGSERVEPGIKTVADCWDWLPYENRLVTVELTAADLQVMLDEDRGNRWSNRVLWPFESIRANGRWEIRLNDQPLDPERRYRIALNSYDAQSGGRTMMALREMVMRPESRRRMTSIGTRQALIDWLLEQKEI